MWFLFILSDPFIPYSKTSPVTDTWYPLLFIFTQNSLRSSSTSSLSTYLLMFLILLITSWTMVVIFTFWGMAEEALIMYGEFMGFL